MMKIRSRALDVFRGLTVALMILVNNPGSWTTIYAPFKHAPWHGLTPTDLVFPFFLFAVGNALALVSPDVKKTLKRTLSIFSIGLFLNWYPFAKSFEELRFLGVLQRIALAYGCASLVSQYFKKHVLLVSFGLLFLYWVLCVSFGTGDVYSLEGWFGTPIDRIILGTQHLYQGEGVAFDPEGLLSTIPCISQVLFGYWIGLHLRRPLLKIGLAFSLCGAVWSLVHPVNKKIWTGSYVLLTTGLAVLLLGLLVKKLDEEKIQAQWARIFEAFGKNPLFIFVLSVLITKTFREQLKWFYEHVCSKFPGVPENGSLLYALLLVMIYGIMAWVLDRKKIYVRV